MFVPLLLVLIGAASLINTLGIYPVNWDMIWPLLLIVIGIYMLVRRNSHSRWECRGCNVCSSGEKCKVCADCKHCEAHK